MRMYENVRSIWKCLKKMLDTQKRYSISSSNKASVLINLCNFLF